MARKGKKGKRARRKPSLVGGPDTDEEEDVLTTSCKTGLLILEVACYSTGKEVFGAAACLPPSGN